MCSIEEAWAGQNFDGKRVISQGDIHNNYMSLPDTISIRDNDIDVNKSKQSPLKNLPRGINSKYSRESRVPKVFHNTTNADLNISSQMPEINNYGGLEPLPSYMTIYNNSNSNPNKNTPLQTTYPYSTQPSSMQPYSTQPYPTPVMTGENFTDIDNAYTISDTLSNFMNVDTNLLDEDTIEDTKIINNKFNTINKNNSFIDLNYRGNRMNNGGSNMTKNSKNMSNTQLKNNKNNLIYNNSLNYNNSNDTNNDNINDTDIKTILNNIIKKIDKIEKELHYYNQKNIYDIILYIIICILFSFCMYSIFSKIKK